MTSTKKPNTPAINLIIGPDHTTLDGEIHYPNNIVIMLENGHSFDIDEIVDVLETIDKKRRKTKAHPIRRMRHLGQAFKTALRESLEDDDSGMAVKVDR